MANPYEAVALKLVPVGSYRHSVVELRQQIAQTLKEEISKALCQQREQQFPDLVAEKQMLETWRQKLQKYQHTLEQREAHYDAGVKQKEAALAEQTAALVRREEKLTVLLRAFESYCSWLSGDGDVTDNTKRFTALREAYQQFKETK